ncbi:hypothetical protein VTN96DRAFT_9453 [Rasamsonia emersonii]
MILDALKLGSVSYPVSFRKLFILTTHYSRRTPVRHDQVPALRSERSRIRQDSGRDLCAAGIQARRPLNNAGTGANLVQAGAKTAQGFEAMVGMHCVATLLFTQLLLPQLRAAASRTSASVRVVWTSSFLAEAASPANGIDFDRLETGTTDRTHDYAVSKVGTWMLDRELARRYGKDGIVSVIQNPGNLKAGSYAGTPTVAMFFIRPLLYEAKFGAYTELYAGLSPDITLESNNGAYVIP